MVSGITRFILCFKYNPHEAHCSMSQFPFCNFLLPQYRFVGFRFITTILGSKLLYNVVAFLLICFIILSLNWFFLFSMVTWMIDTYGNQEQRAKVSRCIFTFFTLKIPNIKYYQGSQIRLLNESLSPGGSNRFPHKTISFFLNLNESLPRSGETFNC
jgi:hypothetical protein